MIERRRAFITLLGGAAAAWPLVARAQQGQRVRRIGALMNLAADDPVSIARAKAFTEGLQALGWVDGRNVQIDYRWAASKPDLFQRHAAELATLVPDVILAAGGAALPAVLQATRTIPVVFLTPPIRSETVRRAQRVRDHPMVERIFARRPGWHRRASDMAQGTLGRPPDKPREFWTSPRLIVPPVLGGVRSTRSDESLQS